MFGRKKTDSTQELVNPQLAPAPSQPTLDWIQPTKDVHKAIASFSLFEPNMLLELAPEGVYITLKEKVEEKDGMMFRTDYVLVPQDTIIVRKDRFEILDKYVERFDSIITKHIALNDDRENDSPSFTNKPSEIFRSISSDGWDTYYLGDLRLLEVKSDVCNICADCNEQITTWNLYSGSYSRNENGGALNEVRTFRIHNALQEVLARSKMAIIALEHPCANRSLNSIIYRNYKQAADPPKLEVVFPPAYAAKMKASY